MIDDLSSPLVEEFHGCFTDVMVLIFYAHLDGSWFMMVEDRVEV